MESKLALMRSFSVSIIIPAYNEEKIIEKAINQALTILNAESADYEIIIVNDGSSDKTAELINSYSNHFQKITVFHKLQNEGFGSAVRKGISMATKTHLLCVPVDSPLTIELFTIFRDKADCADIIVSYRKKRLGYSKWKLFNSWIYHILITYFFSINLRDYNWIHMYNRKIFTTGKIEIEYKGIFMLAEILIKAKRKGFTFYEVEVEQTERLTGIATASKPSAIIKTIFDVFSFRFGF